MNSIILKLTDKSIESKAMNQIDRQDQIILTRLAVDARLSWAELGQELGLSPPAVAERVKRLRQRGLIPSPIRQRAW